MSDWDEVKHHWYYLLWNIRLALRNKLESLWEGPEPPRERPKSDPELDRVFWGKYEGKSDLVEWEKRTQAWRRIIKGNNKLHQTRRSLGESDGL